MKLLDKNSLNAEIFESYLTNFNVKIPQKKIEMECTLSLCFCVEQLFEQIELVNPKKTRKLLLQNHIVNPIEYWLNEISLQFSKGTNQEIVTEMFNVFL